MPNDLVPQEKLPPALAALPRPAMRAFVLHMNDPDLNGRGRFVDAARRAGYTGPPEIVGRTAQRLLRHPLVVKAMEEQHLLLLRHMGPDAISATRNLVEDNTHKDHWKAVNMIHERVIGAVTQKHEVAVTVEVDNSKMLRTMLRQEMRAGANEEYLLNRYGRGPQGYLDMKAEIEAEDRERARADANVVEGEFEMIADEKAIIDDALVVTPEEPEDENWMQ